MKKNYLCSILFLLSFYLSVCQAGINLATKRVIFQGNQLSQSVILKNDTRNAYLVQAFITQKASFTKTTSCSFQVFPPLFRLESGNKYQVTIIRIDDNFSKHKESLCHLRFNLLPILFKDKERKIKVSTKLQLTFKLLYRPDKLLPDIVNSYNLLKVSHQKNEVVIHNPTPYYQSLASLKLDNQTIDLNYTESMLAPYSSICYQVKKSIRKVYYRLINDYGGITEEIIQIITPMH